MIENLEVLCHSSIRLSKGKTIYFDPFKIKDKYNDADYIFITHSHFDHYSEEDINKIRKEDTIIVAPKDLINKIRLNRFRDENVIIVRANNTYETDDLKFKTIPAYNVNKQFHEKQNGWVGYIVEIDGIKYYVAGDTDITEENRKVECDVALVPVGGTYTMVAEEAAQLVNEIKPKYAVPIHYGEIVGTNEDAQKFINLLDDEIQGKILLKN